MITYIYAFRNRELDRVKRSLDSLSLQNDTDFEVVFVDYGSALRLSLKVKSLVESYTFARYIYSYSEGTPWNRAKALNIGIKQVKTPYLLTMDVDMIFHSGFNSLVKHKADLARVTFFKVGYLSKNETYSSTDFVPKSYSNHRAKGICLYPLASVKAIQGFDEFYNCWGAEDEDMVSRLKFSGLPVEFNETDCLIYHQYHKPYKALNDSLLTNDLKYQFVRYYNDAKRKYTLKTKQSIVNTKNNWGVCVSERDYNALKTIEIKRHLPSFKPEIDFFLNYELTNLPTGDYGIKFTELAEPSRKISLKYIVYRLVKLKFKDPKIPRNYTLKAVNDLILKTMIYNNIPYHYTVNAEANYLELRFKKL